MIEPTVEPIVKPITKPAKPETKPRPEEWDVPKPKVSPSPKA